MCLMAAFVPHRPDKYFHVTELALYTARDHDCISDRIGSGIRNVRDADVVSLRSVRSQRRR